MESVIYKSYVSQILKYPLMTFEEEIEHSKRIQQGDALAKSHLVQANLRLVVSIAKKFENSYVSIMDLIQEGNIGLLTAASKYHYSFNTRFSTYAYSWIIQSITRFIRNKSGMIIIPHRKEELIRKIHATKTMLFQKNGREPSIQEIADSLHLSLKEINDVMVFSYTLISMDTDIDNDSGQTLAEMIPDSQYTPEKKLLNELKSNEIQQMIQKLPEMEQRVIYSRFNFGYNQKTQTLRQVGEELGVSAETVRQMELRAIKHLKNAAADSDISMLA